MLLYIHFLVYLFIFFIGVLRRTQAYLTLIYYSCQHYGKRKLGSAPRPSTSFWQTFSCSCWNYFQKWQVSHYLDYALTACRIQLQSLNITASLYFCLFFLLSLTDSAFTSTWLCSNSNSNPTQIVLTSHQSGSPTRQNRLRPGTVGYQDGELLTVGFHVLPARITETAHLMLACLTAFHFFCFDFNVCLFFFLQKYPVYVMVHVCGDESNNWGRFHDVLLAKFALNFHDNICCRNKKFLFSNG